MSVLECLDFSTKVKEDKTTQINTDKETPDAMHRVFKFILRIRQLLSRGADEL